MISKCLSINNFKAIKTEWETAHLKFDNIYGIRQGVEGRSEKFGTVARHEGFAAWCYGGKF